MENTINEKLLSSDITPKKTFVLNNFEYISKLPVKVAIEVERKFKKNIQTVFGNIQKNPEDPMFDALTFILYTACKCQNKDITMDDIENLEVEEMMLALNGIMGIDKSAKESEPKEDGAEAEKN